jgi:hypothetical protein
MAQVQQRKLTSIDVSDRLAERKIRIRCEQVLARDLRFEVMGHPAAVFECPSRNKVVAGEDRELK